MAMAKAWDFLKPLYQIPRRMRRFNNSSLPLCLSHPVYGDDADYCARICVKQVLIVAGGSPSVKRGRNADLRAVYGSYSTGAYPLQGVLLLGGTLPSR